MHCLPVLGLRELSLALYSPFLILFHSTPHHAVLPLPCPHHHPRPPPTNLEDVPDDSEEAVFVVPVLHWTPNQTVNRETGKARCVHLLAVPTLVIRARRQHRFFYYILISAGQVGSPRDCTAYRDSQSKARWGERRVGWAELLLASVKGTGSPW
jgi:hypothetical protein